MCYGSLAAKPQAPPSACPPCASPHVPAATSCSGERVPPCLRHKEGPGAAWARCWPLLCHSVTPCGYRVLPVTPCGRGAAGWGVPPPSRPPLAALLSPTRDVPWAEPLYLSPHRSPHPGSSPPDSRKHRGLLSPRLRTQGLSRSVPCGTRPRGLPGGPGGLLRPILTPLGEGGREEEDGGEGTGEEIQGEDAA